MDPYFRYYYRLLKAGIIIFLVLLLISIAFGTIKKWR